LTIDLSPQRLTPLVTLQPILDDLEQLLVHVSASLGPIFHQKRARNPCLLGNTGILQLHDAFEDTSGM
jgi:hypothetical protein